MGKVERVIDTAHKVRESYKSVKSGRYDDLYIPLWEYTKQELEEASVYLNNKIKLKERELEERYKEFVEKKLGEFKAGAIDKEEFIKSIENFYRSGEKQLDKYKNLNMTIKHAIRKYDNLGKYYHNMRYVTPKQSMTVSNVNAYTPSGNRCRKDRRLESGKKYLVVGEFVSTSLATHGTQCFKIQDEDLYMYYVAKDDVVSL